MVGLVSIRRTIPSPWHWVPFPQALVQQVVVPETNSRESLLQSCVANRRCGGCGVGLPTKIAGEQRDMLERRGRGIYAVGPTVAKELVKATAVSLDGRRRSSQVVEQRQPGPALWLGCDQWVVRPDGRGHVALPVVGIEGRGSFAMIEAPPTLAFHVTYYWDAFTSWYSSASRQEKRPEKRCRRSSSCPMATVGQSSRSPKSAALASRRRRWYSG